MNKKQHISEAVIKRLPRYYRYICSLEANNQVKISSSALAKALDVTASQVRQDFSNFGEFGQQGYGYDVLNLKSELASILGIKDKQYNMIIVGAGNIGRALAHYTGFKKDGFVVKAVFDINTNNIVVPEGVSIYNVSQLGSYIKSEPTDIAIIATQRDIAKSVATQLVDLGVKNIWNFAPVDLHFEGDVKIENINMSDSLLILAYKMNNEM